MFLLLIRLFIYFSIYLFIYLSLLLVFNIRSLFLSRCSFFACKSPQTVVVVRHRWPRAAKFFSNWILKSRGSFKVKGWSTQVIGPTNLAQNTRAGSSSITLIIKRYWHEKRYWQPYPFVIFDCVFVIHSGNKFLRPRVLSKIAREERQNHKFWWKRGSSNFQGIEKNVRDAGVKVCKIVFNSISHC